MYSKSIGGKREGAGAKPKSKGGAAKPRRIPIGYNDVVDEVIEHLDRTSDLSIEHSPATSQPIVIKSGDGFIQEITIVTKTIKAPNI